jgi:hypothetical protein
MTKLEIIEETVKYYSEDVSRRSIGEFRRCLYKGPDGKECAFQRCVETDLTPYERMAAEDIMSKNIVKFKPGYEDHEIDFWGDIQTIHDHNLFWNDKGLSEEGLRYVQSYKDKWKDK